MTLKTDISIDGALGFYQLVALTPAAKLWMKQVEGFNGVEVCTDDTRCAQDIAEGAVTDGLIVEVNGVGYLRRRQNFSF